MRGSSQSQPILASNSQGEAEPSAGWRPIGSAPENTLVVVTDGEDRAAVSALEPTDYGCFYWALEADGFLDWEPTHWMPLPPSESGGEPLVCPIDMVLHCPACGLQHIDEPEALIVGGWENPPHRSHLCLGCGHIWRPADVPTNGVAAVATKGQQDSPAPSRTRGAADGALERQDGQLRDEPNV